MSLSGHQDRAPAELHRAGPHGYSTMKEVSECERIWLYVRGCRAIYYWARDCENDEMNPKPRRRRSNHLWCVVMVWLWIEGRWCGCGSKAERSSSSTTPTPTPHRSFSMEWCVELAVWRGRPVANCKGTKGYFVRKYMSRAYAWKHPLIKNIYKYKYIIWITGGNGSSNLWEWRYLIGPLLLFILFSITFSHRVN